MAKKNKELAKVVHKDVHHKGELVENASKLLEDDEKIASSKSKEEAFRRQLSKELKTFRYRKHWRQEKLAAHVGVDKKTISLWERMLHTPCIMSFQKLVAKRVVEEYKFQRWASSLAEARTQAGHESAELAV